MKSVIVATAGMLLVSGIAQAVEIKVLASNAIKEAYLELVPQFEKASGHKVATTWAGTNDIKKRIAAGETYDLIIMSRASLDDIVKSGKVVAGSPVNLVKSGIGIAVRAGAPKPDISSGEAVKKAVLAAKSVGYSTGPSGTYLVGLFQRMGIADAIKAKVVVSQPGHPVGEYIARGEAEIGFQQVSELLPVKGIIFVGPLPADIQEITTFAGGLHIAATQPGAAGALVKFITAPAAVPVIKRKGLEPG